MLAGGKAVGPYDTERGTVKSHCETKNWETDEIFCHPEYLVTDQWGDWCDTFCGPFGGSFRDNGMGSMFCDWTEGTDPMGRCPQEW